jgi:serine/threonine protein kinase
VLDLGAARHLDQPLAPVQGRGTPTYVAPEVCERLPSVDTQADVYSLGILLYELLVGTPPLQPGTPAQLVAQHVYARLAPLPPSMNWGELATIYETATARDPERRYRGARELASAIDLFRNRRLREASRPAALTPGGIEPGQPSLLDTLLARTPRTDERSQPRLRLPSGGYGAPSRPSDPPPPAPTWPRPGEGSESE